MQIDIITLFPEMFQALNTSIIGRAQKNNLLTLNFFNPRDFANNKHKTVDDKPFGGGPGMVMQYQPLRDAINAAKDRHGHDISVIYLSPQGKRLTQNTAITLSKKNNMILLCGRYEGIDERIITQHVDYELSIGDYVLSGGELPAMVLIDTITRLLPNALGDNQSAKDDSFMQGLLDYPHYTRPEIIDNLQVPSVLLSGNHEKIRQWQAQQALLRTYRKRPDLLNKEDLAKAEKLLSLNIKK